MGKNRASLSDKRAALAALDRAYDAIIAMPRGELFHDDIRALCDTFEAQTERLERELADIERVVICRS